MNTNKINFLCFLLFFGFFSKAFSSESPENPQSQPKNALIKVTKICLNKLPEGFKVAPEGLPTPDFNLASPFHDHSKLIGTPQVYINPRYPDVSILAFSVVKNALDTKNLPVVDLGGDSLKVLVEKSKDFDTTGSLYLVQHIKNTVRFLKWVAIFSDDKQTSIVSAVFPENKKEILENSLLDTMSYAKLSETCK